MNCTNEFVDTHELINKSVQTNLKIVETNKQILKTCKLIMKSHMYKSEP